MKFTTGLFFTLISAFVLLGCTSVSTPTTPTHSEIPTPSPTFTQATPTYTPTPPEISTLTPLATLNSEQAKEAISILLRGTGDCDFPCFWGLIPGQTALGEAQNIFNHLRLQINNTTYEGKDFYGINNDFDSGLSISVILTIQNEIIENIRVKVLPEKQRVGVPREWLAYSPEILITRYGEPSRVVFALDWGPRPYFEMDMYFDKVDLIVQYMGHNIISKQKGPSQVCPLASQFESVRLWMGEDPVYPPAEAVTLLDATEMTIEEFSNLMTGSPNKACFIVKGEAFP